MLVAPAVSEWVLHPRRDPDRALGLARALGSPVAVAHALVNRGVDTEEAARRFLSPDLDDLHDPMGLRDLDRAVERVAQAVWRGERILVHGDYDVDGITSTFVLYAVLAELGGRVEYHIPHRTRDGYGLSDSAIELARRRGCTLIVTVDCGITAVAAVERASAAGIDTVITDHHAPLDTLPAACAVVNPLRPGCGYPFKSLAGVGVTFKLAQALLRGRGGLERAREFLDVVALGTIADVVPLTGENRVLARYGLDRLGATTRPGIKALMEVAGMSGRRITSSEVAFVLAPRINAAGRMGNAEQSLRLLLARDAPEARACAESLEEDNRRRREFDERALVQAIERVESETDWPRCASIVLWSEDWHPGVIGIVASRLVERYQRPTVLVALDGERGRGSGRSLPGLDLNRVLSRCTDLLEAWGGHALAAGLTVRRERLPELRARIESLVEEELAPGDKAPRLTVDADVSLRECGLETVDWLERLSPHGLDNAAPLFRASGLVVESATAVGGGKHLRATLRDATGRAEAIGFGLGSLAPELARTPRCDAVFVPDRNEWQGETRAQLKLKGVRVA
ncbi:MAG TPA: single-stranded-DNA-specific exonuclease RecJ [Candidatus Eisenbacteria bacterium]|jgi:single-stranded-DNA-specific exonuclease